MSKFFYQPILSIGKDDTKYRLLTKDYVKKVNFEKSSILKIDKEALTLLAFEAFSDVSHLLRVSHLKLLKKIINDPEASENDKYVAFEMIKNAVISAEGIFPMCQDTGTAIIMGKKGEDTKIDGDDEEALSRGVFDAYTNKNLRYSQNSPINLYEEKNTGTNLPAQIELYSVKGAEYSFLFIAKGGGSANKTFLFQKTKAVLNPDSMVSFLKEEIKHLGTAACPPYHLSIVIGGTSAEFNLKTVKLASAGYLDTLPLKGNEFGQGFRDIELEKKILDITRDCGFGAQFGGKYFCHDVRVVRLPRHGASCPIGIGVSCSADRNIKGKITKDGVFLEQLEKNPEKYLPDSSFKDDSAVKIDLNMPMNKLREILSKYPVSTRLSLSGKIVVARDIAHAKLKERLDSKGNIPDYIKNHIIYYAGPAKTPEGWPSGSFGPTTAARMDPYVPIFQEKGASMIMLAKGNRSKIVTDSCRKYGGFYLGSIGGPAARLAKECITDVKVLEYEELGMEAIFIIEVKDFPAFIIVDDKGNDFFEKMMD
jgi:fumarate hydratase, class I